MTICPTGFRAIFAASFVLKFLRKFPLSSVTNLLNCGMNLSFILQYKATDAIIIKNLFVSTIGEKIYYLVILTTTERVLNILSPSPSLYATNSIGLFPISKGMIVNGIATASLPSITTDMRRDFFPGAAIEQNDL